MLVYYASAFLIQREAFFIIRSHIIFYNIAQQKSQWAFRNVRLFSVL